MGTRVWVVIFALVLSGCATSTIIAWTDEEGAEISAEKMAVVDRFRLNLADPTKGVSKGAGPQSDYEFKIEIPEVLTLQDAIRIATKYNRNFIGQRESFFLSMLGLGLTRYNFLSPQFSGSISWGGSILEDAKLSESTTIALSGSKLLPTGGSVSASASGSMGTADDGLGGRPQSASSSASISFSQPLLRGAGRTIAWEGFTQAERSAVYTARGFETFKQDFAINVITRYFSLVSRKKGLKNVKDTVANQEYLLRSAQALFRLQQGTQQDVLRARQSLRDAKNAELESQQSWELAKDRFKIFLGLPLKTEITIGNEVPPIGKFDAKEGRYVELVEIKMDEEKAVDAALHNRLDMATQRDQLEDTIRGVRISKNALLPSLDFSASASIGSNATNSLRDLSFGPVSGSFGLSMEIPLNKKAQRNSYRAALIRLAQAKRSLRLTEDETILGVRDALRRLKQQRQQITNDEENVEVIRRAAQRADLDNRAGLTSNRDLSEALENLGRSRNELLVRYVSYYTTILQFKQQLGLLFVDKEGRIVE